MSKERRNLLILGLLLVFQFLIVALVSHGWFEIGLLVVIAGATVQAALSWRKTRESA
jgi:hypothetical protein